MSDDLNDIEDYMRKFRADADKRRAKLDTMDVDSSSKFSVPIHTPRKQREEVNYPNLTPLPEGDETGMTFETTNQRDDETMTNLSQEGENMSPSRLNLNYSSDLSLEVEPSELYRAEPIYADSSPEIHTNTRPRLHQNQLQQPLPYGSPRKLAPLATQQDQRANHQDLGQSAEHESPSMPPMAPPPTTEQLIMDLQHKQAIAEATKNQLKKLVVISKYGTKEHIDVAKRLQIADLESMTYTMNIVSLKRDGNKKSESLGSIEVSGIKVKLSNKMRDDLAEDGISHHFFCVAACGTEVKASEIIDTNDIRIQDSKSYLHFKNNWCKFDGMPPDFVLKLEIFEHIIYQKMPRFLHTLTPSKKGKFTPEPNFKRVGSMQLTFADREVRCKNFVRWSEVEESKYIERECKFHMELKPEQLPSKSGRLNFRNLRNENMPDWTRYWVEMSGGQIKFWRSRQDSFEGKKPNHLINFADICSDIAQKLTPNDDMYRQFSFVIYSVQLLAGGEGNTLLQRVLKGDNNYKIVKHQFAADDKADRDAWCNVFNKSINCYREWQGRTRIYTVEEVLQIFSEH